MSITIDAKNRFEGFYYMLGDIREHGYIRRVFSFTDDLSDTLINITYQDILNRFKNPVMISRNTGTYDSVFVVDDDEDKTRNTIKTTSTLWKNIFAIANYVYNKFYWFADTNFISQIGSDTQTYSWSDYIENVLSGIIDDSVVQKTGLYKLYVPKSLNIFHCGDISEASKYKKLRKFSFKVVDQNDDSVFYEIIMWTNPEGFTGNDGQKGYTYSFDDFKLWYDSNAELNADDDFENNRDTAKSRIQDAVNEVSELIGKDKFKYHQKYSFQQMRSDKDDANDSTSYFMNTMHVWSNGEIPANVFIAGSKINIMMRDLIASKNPTMSKVELAKRYPSIFTDIDSRIIYPLYDNDGVTQQSFVNTDNASMVVTSISLDTINNTIGHIGDLKELKTFDASTVRVDENYVAFIVGGAKDKALIGTIPFYKPTVEEILAIQDYDSDTANMTNTTDAVNFCKILAAILDIQVNDKTQLEAEAAHDIKLSDFGYTTSTLYAEFSLCNLKWKVINRNYNPNNLGG